MFCWKNSKVQQDGTLKSFSTRWIQQSKEKSHFIRIGIEYQAILTISWAHCLKCHFAWSLDWNSYFLDLKDFCLVFQFDWSATENVKLLRESTGWEKKTQGWILWRFILLFFELIDIRISMFWGCMWATSERTILSISCGGEYSGTRWN